MEMAGLVVVRRQDAPKRVHVGDVHEDALKRDSEPVGDWFTF